MKEPKSAIYRKMAQDHSAISIEYAISVLEDIKNANLVPSVWEICNPKIQELKKLIP